MEALREVLLAFEAEVGVLDTLDALVRVGCERVDGFKDGACEKMRSSVSEEAMALTLTSPT